ncbi:AMP-binding protein [Galbitalea sp. SE-J8]|uniref:AMP-binding protein n=1 Tax=Galbitalea sp. SE-J8 TaxID=3054952 RepID=UPI00259CE50B|nr:AMP-binding protein [Galbitalea sp. SE-J8]MDM4762403.1 AMP-binding protein [Galbitalea sp. SE-J8]
MTRRLAAAPAAALPAALHAALDGSGPAVFAGGDPGDLPARVPQRVALVVASSGSTGRPKRVALSADAVLASAAASDAALGGPGQWLLALPTSYIAGVNVLVRSIAAGTTPVAMPAGHFDAAGFADAAALLVEPRRYTALVPAQLARLLAEPVGRAALARFAGVLVGGQATPPALLERAHDAGIAVVTTYGSSETSGGCVYDGVPFGTVDVRIEGADAAGRGELLLGGPVLAEGYLGDPARTDAAFVERDGRRWYRTGDVGEIDAGGVVSVVGRRDDMIVSGGVNVFLGAVERVVRGLPGLGDAVVIGGAHPEWGAAPVVVTAASVEPEATLARVRDAVAAELGRAAAPARVERIPAIPQLASGKPDRRRIAREFGG